MVEKIDKGVCLSCLNTALNAGFYNAGSHIDIIKINDMQVANEIKDINIDESRPNKSHSDWSVTSATCINKKCNTTG